MNTELKITDFHYDGISQPVTFIETNQVKEGVQCDVYCFDNDATQDLAIIRVDPGYSTPKQRVVSGDHTIEGFMSGRGTLVIERGGETVTHEYDNPATEPVMVRVGDTMQWTAHLDGTLVFYELCSPPYSGGRFQNL